MPPTTCPDGSHAHLSTRQLYSEGETDFRVCPACGLAFREQFPGHDELDAIYAEAYRVDAIEHNATNQESTDFATETYGRFVTERFTRPDMTVFDFGAATGALVERLRSQGLRAEGFEFSASARAHARAARRLDLMGSLDSIPAGAYDLVTMIEVIEHLTDLQGTLRKLRAALKPGGRLLVTTPSRTSWRARLEGGHWREATKKFHLFLFDDASLRHHLLTAGFVAPLRVRFSPVLRPGLKSQLIVRGTQALGLGGTLCISVRRD